jgi:hypothetical protein
VLQFAFALPEMIGMVVPQDTDMMMCEEVSKGCVVGCGLSIAWRDDYHGKVGSERMAKMIVDEGNSLTALVTTLSWNTNDRRSKGKGVDCSFVGSQTLVQHAIDFSFGIRSESMKAEADSNGWFEHRGGDGPLGGRYSGHPDDPSRE